jgi:RNA polymerase sigma-70 factor (ECF subfamily)
MRSPSGRAEPGVEQSRAAVDPDAVAARADAVEDASDARLVERARLGDDAAFAALVGRYERKLLRVLARLVRDEHLAFDLAQETFWKVYTRLDRFDTARRFGPWLFRVGVNLGLDYLRRGGPAPASIDRSRATHEPTEPDPRHAAELAQEVRHVLERLPLEYRTVLILRDLEGFSSAEVAAIVERREATVRWRLAKAREMFRQHWQRRQLAWPGSDEGAPDAWLGAEPEEAADEA